MKKVIILGLILATCMLIIVGCQKTKPDTVSLDSWLEEVALKKLVDDLSSNSFLKGLPFIIVKAKGEEISNTIDNLTKDIRDRMVSVFLQHSQIKLVRRHPVSSSFFDRPYALQQLPCGRYTEPQMVVMVSIKKLEQLKKGSTARVDIRATNLETGAWLPVSLFSDVALTGVQTEALDKVGPDEYLRGLKYVPFEESQGDDMAAYLAQNLSCIFQQAQGGKDVSVYFDETKMGQRFSDIVWVLEKRLNFANEITLINKRDQADWVLDAEARVTDKSKGLWQVWVDVWEQKGGESVKGLATYAYFLSMEKAEDMSGTWWIYDVHSRDLSGRLEMKMLPGKGYRADLFGSHGELRAQGIVVNLSDQNISWTYYDRELNKIFETSGVIQRKPGNERIILGTRTFPPSSMLIEQELLSYKREN